MPLIAVLGGLGTLFSWGICDYLASKQSRLSDAYSISMVLHVVQLCMVLLISIWLGLDVAIDGRLAVLVLVSIIIGAAYVSYIHAFSRGPAGIVAPLGNSYAVYTLIIGIVVFGYDLMFWQVALLGVIVLGSIGVSYQRRSSGRSATGHRHAVRWAITAAALWGAGFALLDIVIPHYQWHELLLVISVVSALFSLAGRLIMGRTDGYAAQSLARLANGTLLWAGLLLGVGSIALLMAADMSGGVVVPVVLASASPLITACLAWLLDGERLKSHQRVSAVVIVLGIMLLSAV